MLGRIAVRLHCIAVAAAAPQQARTVQAVRHLRLKTQGIPMRPQ